MPFFKEVWQYTLGDKGFSEVWYSEESSLAQAATFPAALLNAAVAFRNALCTLRKIRVSSVDNNRNAVVVNANVSAPFSDRAPAPTGAAVIFTVVSTEKGSKRQVWFRGVDQLDIGRSPTTGRDTPSPQMINNMKAYLRQLVLFNYRVRSLLKLPGGGVGYRRITEVTSVANTGKVTLAFSGDAVIASNRLIITQINPKDFPGLKGAFSVLRVIDATHVEIPYNMHVTGTFPTTTGRFRLQEYEYGRINADLCRFNFTAARDTGKSPLGGRGRRSAARIRSL